MPRKRDQRARAVLGEQHAQPAAALLLAGRERRGPRAVKQFEDARKAVGGERVGGAGLGGAREQHAQHAQHAARAALLVDNQRIAV